MLEESIQCQEHLKLQLAVLDRKNKTDRASQDSTCLNIAVEIFGATMSGYLQSMLDNMLTGKKCAELSHYAYQMSQYWQFRHSLQHAYLIEFAGGREAARFMVDLNNLVNSHETFSKKRMEANEASKKAIDEYQLSRGLFQAFHGLSCFTYVLAQIGVIPNSLEQYE